MKDFDPTYEAWKLDSSFSQEITNLYFDPTYEAWKHLVGSQ